MVKSKSLTIARSGKIKRGLYIVIFYFNYDYSLKYSMFLYSDRYSYFRHVDKIDNLLACECHLWCFIFYQLWEWILVFYLNFDSCFQPSLPNQGCHNLVLIKSHHPVFDIQFEVACWSYVDILRLFFQLLGILSCFLWGLFHQRRLLYYFCQVEPMGLNLGV